VSLAHRASLRRFAQINEASGIGPLAARRLDSPAQQQRAIAVGDDASGDQLRSEEIDESAFAANFVFFVIGRDDAQL